MAASEYAFPSEVISALLTAFVIMAVQLIMSTLKQHPAEAPNSVSAPSLSHGATSPTEEEQQEALAQSKQRKKKGSSSSSKKKGSTVREEPVEVKFTQLFINNCWVDAADGSTFACLNPSTGEEICQVAEVRYIADSNLTPPHTFRPLKVRTDCHARRKKMMSTPPWQQRERLLRSGANGGASMPLSGASFCTGWLI
jgi:hypothetical protein